jgi:tryptophan-rich sensory protein
VLLIELVGGLGALFNGSIKTWYSTLNKPSFSPPNWIFGPVWTTLFLLMGISLALVILSKETKARKKALFYFGIQLVLNVAWSFFFFYLQSPLLGLLDILLLLIFIATTIYHFHKVNRSAAWLLVPYILWVTFATALNLAILIKN